MSTTHVFSEAPSPTPATDWKVVATEVGPNGESYFAGYFGDDDEVDTTLDFGCGEAMVNPSSSRHDTFLVKFDASGNCVWQHSLGSNTPWDGDQLSFYAQDIALTPTGNVVLAVQQYWWPGALSGNDSGTGSTVYEITEDSNGDPQVTWLHNIGAQEGYRVWMTSLGVDQRDNLVVGGSYDIGFDFAGSSIIDPTSSEGFEAFVLSFGDLSGGTRAEVDEEHFGGNGANFIEDTAVHSDGTIAVVGVYDDQHTSVGGNPGPAANNQNVFIETLDHKLQPIDDLTSSSSFPYRYDTEYATAAAFDPSGILHVTGWFKGELEPQGNGGIGPDNPIETLETEPNDSDDVDWFVVSYEDVNIDLGTVDLWTHSKLNETNGDAVTIERAWDISVNEYIVAIGGNAECFQDNNDQTNCDRTGFVYAEGTSTFNTGDSLSDYTLNYGYGSQASAVDAVGLGPNITHWDTLAVGGDIAGSNVDLGGGPLPGPYGFLAGYELQ